MSTSNKLLHIKFDTKYLSRNVEDKNNIFNAMSIQTSDSDNFFNREKSIPQTTMNIQQIQQVIQIGLLYI